jgi:hypothetical protein
MACRTPVDAIPVIFLLRHLFLGDFQEQEVRQRTQINFVANGAKVRPTTTCERRATPPHLPPTQRCSHTRLQLTPLLAPVCFRLTRLASMALPVAIDYLLFLAVLCRLDVT